MAAWIKPFLYFKAFIPPPIWLYEMFRQWKLQTNSLPLCLVATHLRHCPSTVTVPIGASSLSAANSCTQVAAALPTILSSCSTTVALAPVTPEPLDHLAALALSHLLSNLTMAHRFELTITDSALADSWINLSSQDQCSFLLAPVAADHSRTDFSGSDSHWNCS